MDARQWDQAIIIGGSSAIHPNIDDELIALGLDEIFRVGGANRFATAAAVAQGLGTESVPSGTESCFDPLVLDGDARMAFYGNSIVEWRPSPTECHLLGNAVVLADGLSGADALAAGWWTSYWQVPVILHNGTTSLPRETLQTLQSLDVSNVIILGGERRIPVAIEQQIRSISDIKITRVAGADRYETSIKMAQQFGGWYPSGRAQEFESSMVCIAASSGGGRGALGWADTLGAGAWCGAAAGSAATTRPPRRALSPVWGQNPVTSAQLQRPRHDAVPILLVPATVRELPFSIFQFLTGVYEPADSWCSSVSSPQECVNPGFAVVFGGKSRSVTLYLASLPWWRRHLELTRPGTSLTCFTTALSMRPVYREAGQGNFRSCVSREGLAKTRWLGIGYDQSPKI